MLWCTHADLPAGNLRAGLTKEKRARDAVSETLVGLVTMMPDAKRGKDESAAVKAVVGPQSDLPPVLAGPGRYVVPCTSSCPASQVSQCSLRSCIAEV